jgi:retron-type reverse transcriptase
MSAINRGHTLKKKTMQLDLFSTPNRQENEKISINDIFEAYASCRRNKRNTVNAQAFELDYEQQLLILWKDIHEERYQINPSIAFIVTKPVKREIFAADFRDRVVHHLLISKVNPLFERQFIYDSYACRTGKGTHFGIRRASYFVRACSQNYTKPCYVLKLDIQGFFMHINKEILCNRLIQFMEQYYTLPDKKIILSLFLKVIRNDAAKNCKIKGHLSDWHGLPANKSLFHSPKGCGLPIGNLTSQVLANFYLNPMDHYIKKELRIRYYGRYVDDFILIHHDKEVLKNCITDISCFLSNRLGLTLHPKKVYLQEVTKGFLFLGAYIKPYRTYIGNRTKGNFYAAIQRQNQEIIFSNSSEMDTAMFISSLNSYLGILAHYATYRLRTQTIYNDLHNHWWYYVFCVKDVKKMIKRTNQQYRHSVSVSI